jgi:hypothetical protein
MSAKKTVTKKQTTGQKPAKSKGDGFAAKMAKAREAKGDAHQNGACPKGGEHEFAVDDLGDNICSKCLEPGPKAKGSKPSKAKREPKPAGEKQLSALDAAAKVLEERGQPMNTRQLIEVMSQKGYWTSPGGKTPWATLYSAILREITNDGDAARFVKTERGKFAFRK